jgi:hypothetical protein
MNGIEEDAHQTPWTAVIAVTRLKFVFNKAQVVLFTNNLVFLAGMVPSAVAFAGEWAVVVGFRFFSHLQS